MSNDILASVCHKACGRLWSHLEEGSVVWWDQNWAIRVKHHQKHTILTMKLGGGGGDIMLCKCFSSTGPQRLVMEEGGFSQIQGNPEGVSDLASKQKQR